VRNSNYRIKIILTHIKNEIDTNNDSPDNDNIIEPENNQNPRKSKIYKIS
jgi:hypothetical protein